MDWINLYLLVVYLLFIFLFFFLKEKKIQFEFWDGERT